MVVGLFLFWISSNLSYANYDPSLRGIYITDAYTKLNITLELPQSKVHGSSMSVTLTNNNNRTVSFNHEWMVEGLGGGYWLKQTPPRDEWSQELIEVEPGATIILVFPVGWLDNGIFRFTNGIDFQNGSKNVPIRFIIEKIRFTM